MNLTKSEIREILADLYKKACLEERCEMRDVVDVFENLTQTFISNPTLLAWTKIKIDEKRFGQSPYFELIRNFRNEIFSSYTKKGISEIRNLEKSDPKKAFEKWFEIYTDALITFDWDVMNPLFAESFSFEKESIQAIKSYGLLNKLIEDNKWADSISFFIDLASNSQIPDWKKCYFSNYVSEIFLYYFGYVDKAQDWLQKITELDPDHFLLERLQGEIDLFNKDTNSARNHFLNAVSMESNNVDSYIFMGETFMEEDFETAKQWYMDAIGINFLNSSPYLSMFKLFGKAKWLDEKPEEAAEYISRMEQADIRMVSTVSLYNAYRDVAFGYNLDLKVTEAENYYQKAIELRPDLTAAKIDLGYILSNKEKYEEAEQYFKDALNGLKFNPFEGYWALGGLAEQKGDFHVAISYYQKCLGTRAFGEDRVHNVLGLQYFKLEDFISAFDEFNKAIEDYPNQTVYFDNLKDAAEKSGISQKMEIYHLLLTQNYPQNHIYNNNAGVYFYEKGNFDKAIELYSKAIDIEPESVLYYKNRGLAFQKDNQLVLSEKDYMQALRLTINQSNQNQHVQSENEIGEALEFCKDSDLLNSIGLIKYLQKKYEESILFYFQAIELDDDKSVYRENLAISYEFLGLYKEAIKEYKKVLEKEQEPFLFNAIGRLEYWMMNYQSAIEYYSKALEIAPEVQVYLQNRALAYQDFGNLDAAEKDYLSSLDFGPDIKSLNSIGIIEASKNKHENAIEYFTKAIHIDEFQAILYENRGISYEKITQYELAKSDLQKAIDLEPNDYRINFLGLIYYRNGEYENAIEYYNQAISIKPEEPIYRENRGLAHYFLNEFDLAEIDFKEAIKTNPTTNSFNYLGIIYTRKFDYDKAIEYYTKAINQDPDKAILWENRALSWDSLGEHAKAEADLIKAVELEPNETRFNYLGLISFKIFDYPTAIEFYSKALEMGQGNQVIWENRALAHESNGNFEEAIHDYEECLKISEDAFTYNKLGEIHRTLGNYSEAKALFKKAVELKPDEENYLQNLNDCV